MLYQFFAVEMQSDLLGVILRLSTQPIIVVEIIFLNYPREVKTECFPQFRLQLKQILFLVGKFSFEFNQQHVVFLSFWVVYDITFYANNKSDFIKIQQKVELRWKNFRIRELIFMEGKRDVGQPTILKGEISFFFFFFSFFPTYLPTF